MKAAKSNYFKKGIQESSGNVRETWKLINSTLGRKTKTTLINELSRGGQIYTDKKEIADEMNLHFCTLGEKLAKNIPVTGTLTEQYMRKRASTMFMFTPVTGEQVYDVI